MCNVDGKKYSSDVARIIRKFDIYICDLGEVESKNDLAKTRPCVVVSSNQFNNPGNNSYMVSPIRTEHKVDFKEIGMENYIKEKREKYCRLYAPIEMAVDDFRFIDITETRKVSSCNMLRYVTSIINHELKNSINKLLIEYLFSNEEIDRIYAPGISMEEQLIRKQRQREGIEAARQKGKHLGRPSLKIPDNFEEVYSEWQNGEITAAAAQKKLGMSSGSFYREVNKYKNRSVSTPQNELTPNNQQNKLNQNEIIKENIKLEKNENETTQLVPKKNNSFLTVPTIIASSNFEEIYNSWNTGKISLEEACTKLGLNKTAFNKLVKIYKENNTKENDKEELQNNKVISSQFPIGFSIIHNQVINGKISVNEAASKLGIESSVFITLSNNYEKASMNKNQTTNSKTVSSRKSITITDDFKDVYDEWRIGGLTASEACELLDIPKTNLSKFYRMVKIYETESKESLKI